MQAIKPCQFAVGIDPDIDKSGYAVYDRHTRKLTVVTCLSGDELLDQINEITPGTTHFYVDAGWLNEGYHHYANLPTDFQKWTTKSKEAYLIKCGVQVGRNFGVGQFIVAYLKAHKHLFTEVRPHDAKWDKSKLELVTGWKNRTNSESRDAAKLCFGR